MKIFLFLLLLLPHYAKSETCPVGESFDPGDLKMLEALKDVLKSEYKKRAAPYNTYLKVLDIESNFKVPMVGKDLYFGKIYFKSTDPEVIRYRDEIIAEKHYADEIKDNSFYSSEYKIASITSPKGLSLVEGGGAEVILSSKKFTTSSGGRLNLKVKGPGQAPVNMTFDIEIKDGKIKKYFVSGNQRIEFDTIKINAQDSLILGTNILNGIKDIEFKKSGTKVKTVTPPK